MKNELVKLSKFISLILRHDPAKINITLDEHGWAKVDELINGINQHGHYLDQEMLDQIVATNNKKRFCFNEDHTLIRANQGHSIQVDVELPEKIPPKLLYHGTAINNLDKIKQSGIKKMNRLYVHLSKDVETATKVGSRHGKPVVLIIDTQAMIKDGYKFYYSLNEVWLCDDIDYRYVIDIVTSNI